MATYIILTSRLNKNTCRHGEIYYLDKWTSQKIMSSWRDILSCQVDFPKLISRHGDINYLTKST